jgi:hypothetical protein
MDKWDRLPPGSRDPPPVGTRGWRGAGNKYPPRPRRGIIENQAKIDRSRASRLVRRRGAEILKDESCGGRYKRLARRLGHCEAGSLLTPRPRRLPELSEPSELGWNGGVGFEVPSGRNSGRMAPLLERRISGVAPRAEERIRKRSFTDMNSLGEKSAPGVLKFDSGCIQYPRFNLSFLLSDSLDRGPRIVGSAAGGGREALASGGGCRRGLY